jgi:hypothetical protein
VVFKLVPEPTEQLGTQLIRNANSDSTPDLMNQNLNQTLSNQSL